MIKKLLRESLLNENDLTYKYISRNYLKQLLNQVSNRSGKKFLKGWIAKGSGDSVRLTHKEYALLDIIKKGGPNPKDFHSKN
jgi:hypothetical protein